MSARTVTIPEDTLISQIRDFLDTRVFGPDRAALLEKQIPATAAQATEAHARQRARLEGHWGGISLGV